MTVSSEVLGRMSLPVHVIEVLFLGDGLRRRRLGTVVSKGKGKLQKEWEPPKGAEGVDLKKDQAKTTRVVVQTTTRSHKWVEMTSKKKIPFEHKTRIEELKLNSCLVQRSKRCFIYWKMMAYTGLGMTLDTNNYEKLWRFVVHTKHLIRSEMA